MFGKKKKEESNFLKHNQVFSLGLLFERNDIDMYDTDQLDDYINETEDDNGSTATTTTAAAATSQSKRKKSTHDDIMYDFDGDNGDDDNMLASSISSLPTPPSSAPNSTTATQQQKKKFTLDPTQLPEINHSDVAFLLQSVQKCEDDDYMLKTIIDTEAIKCHLYTEKFDLGHMETRQMIMVRTVGIVPYQLCDVVNSLFDASLPQGLSEVSVEVGKTISSTGTPSTPLSSTSNSSRASVAFSSSINIAIPDTTTGDYSVSVSRRTASYKGLTQLDYCTANSAVYDAINNKFIIVHKSCDHPKVKPIAKSIRSYMVGGTVFESLGNSSDAFLTRYTNIQFLKLQDFGNKKKTIRKAYEVHAMDLYTDLLNKCRTNHSKGFLAPKKISGLYQTLLDYEKNHLEKSIETQQNPWTATWRNETLL